jgi:hypothetical protein
MNTETGPEGPALSVLTGGSPVGSPGEVTVAELFDSSIPKVGAYRTEDHRYYWNRQGPFPSVTSIIGVLDKPAIVTWAKNEVAKTAVDRWEEVGAYIQKEGPDTAKKWLTSLPDFQRDTAAKLGSGVHLLADMVSRGQESDPKTFQVAPEEEPYLEGFRGFLRWLESHGGKIVSSEKMIWSTDGYAGTYDLIIRFSCECHFGLWLTDIKTRKGATYPEDALQLIAYGTADWIITENNPVPYPMPYIQRYGVLHLRPSLYTDTGWRLIEYPLIPSDRMAFLGALEIWRWKQEKRYTQSKLVGTQKG